MSEQTTMKVYELAKELGTDSLSLLDELKKIDIAVKSHMSSLSAEDITRAKDVFEQKSGKKKAKKKTVRKKKAAAVKKKTTAVRKKVSKATSSSPGAASPTTAEEQAVEEAKRAAASTVIRRRVRTDGTVEKIAKPKEAEDSDVQLQPQEESNTLPSEDSSLEVASSISATSPEATPSESNTDQAIEKDPNLSSQPEVSESNPATTPQRVSLLKKVEETEQTPQGGGLKIIKRADQTARKAPSPSPTTPADPSDAQAGGKRKSRIIKMNKENLDKMLQDEANKKRGTGAKDQFVRPEDVRFADYRKKEMVFLPKRKKIPVGKALNRTEITQPAAHKRVVEIGEEISVSELANLMKMKGIQVVKKLMSLGQQATLNQVIDFETASLVASEFNHEVKNVAFDEDKLLGITPEVEENKVLRPPVVTIMGHVDHGKTSLLDAIKETNVVAGEAGGITQHIGAYTIDKEGKKITFIDTPGHEAFSVMRARGANVTDIVVLVVAADDGAMPQTREAISHSQAAGVPIVVAVNKMDKEGANPDRIKQELSELNLLAEDWGGETMFIPVSATEKTNLDKLLEAINLNAEMLELKADPKGPASGTVLEARLEKGKGAVVSVLINRGTLKKSDSVLAGTKTGRVKLLTDHTGQQVKEVGPGMAVEVLGFTGVPNAGDQFNVPPSEDVATKIAEHRDRQQKMSESVSRNKMSLEDLFSKVQDGDLKKLNVVLKADVFGSVEAVKDSLIKASTEKVEVQVIHAATGGITENDINLASASEAIIVGFNVRPETKARRLADSLGIEVRTYKIIYELIEDIKKAMAGLLDKKAVETFLGRAEVRQTFSVPKIGLIAGTAVIDGKIVRGSHVRLLRDSVVVFEGKMGSLRRFKDDAKEVASGYECGIGIEGFNDIKTGDIIEAFKIDMVEQEL